MISNKEYSNLLKDCQIFPRVVHLSVQTPCYNFTRFISIKSVTNAKTSLLYNRFCPF